jgi:hypothetical protein
MYVLDLQSFQAKNHTKNYIKNGPSLLHGLLNLTWAFQLKKNNNKKNKNKKKPRVSRVDPNPNRQVFKTRYPTRVRNRVNRVDPIDPTKILDPSNPTRVSLFGFGSGSGRNL